MEQLLVGYIRENIELSKRFARAPHGRATCKMLLDQSFGAVDFVTNIMEYDKYYSKEEIEEIYKAWESEWSTLLLYCIEIASE